MRFGIFYEHELPRPWTDGSEAQLLAQTLDQVALADRLGFDYAWEVEHHFLEESSARRTRAAVRDRRGRRARPSTPDPPPGAERG